MRSKGSWRTLSKTFSSKLAPKQVREVQSFFRVNQKTNVTNCCGLAGRCRHQGANVSHVVFDDGAEDFLPSRLHELVHGNLLLAPDRLIQNSPLAGSSLPTSFGLVQTLTAGTE